MRNIIFQVNLKQYEYGGNCHEPSDRRCIRNLAKIRLLGNNDIYRAVLKYLKVNTNKSKLTVSAKKALPMLEEFKKAEKHWNGKVSPLLQTCIDMIVNYPITEHTDKKNNYREKLLTEFIWG